MPDLPERLAGGLLGLLIGDALGVPYEFHPADDIPETALIEFDPPEGFRRAHAVPAGTWSDDGAQALCLLTSLLNCRDFAPDDFAHRLIDWYEHGYLAVDNKVFDVGVQTGTAIRRLRAGVPPLEAGSDDDYSQGNGSLMRVLPLALWHKGTDEDLVRLAHAQSRLTHGHLTVQACCALYCVWARRLLERHPEAWGQAVEDLRNVYRHYPEHIQSLETAIRPEAERTPRGSGFVIDCLFSAKAALEVGSYETVVKAAIAFGQDTDTTACVAGGLAGVRDGLAAIPNRWLAQLRDREVAEDLLTRLIAHHQAG